MPIIPQPRLMFNPEMTNGQRSSDPRAVLTSRTLLHKGLLMAARHSTRQSDQPKPQLATHAAMGQPSAIRGGLVPRTIFFPAGFLERIETQPGALVDLLTIALSSHLGKGGAQ